MKCIDCINFYDRNKRNDAYDMFGCKAEISRSFREVEKKISCPDFEKIKTTNHRVQRYIFKRRRNFGYRTTKPPEL